MDLWQKNKKTSLIILDWFWINKINKNSNAIYLAKTPNIDKLFNSKKYSSLEASGKYVWVLDGQIWNSEVWHMTIWSWRIINQTIVEANKLFDNHEFENLEVFKDWINHVYINKSNLHIIWLMWPWWVHAHSQHIKNLIKIIPSDIKVYLHIFWDGRDTDYKSLKENLENCTSFLKSYNNVKIASISGRFYAMDRDNNWDRIEKAYRVIINNENKTNLDPIEYIENSYNTWVFDEFIEPASFTDDSSILSNDSVFFMNFRSDRARQITQAIINDDFPYAFPLKKLENLYFATMTKYYENYKWKVFIEKNIIKDTLPEVFTNNNIKHLHLAETEKFAHVTKFFAWWNNIAYPLQKNILIPSPKVKTYDLKPEMSALELLEIYKKESNKYGFTVVNFANWDMVWHSWSLDASIEAVEVLDKVVWELVEFSKENNTELLITADHWNCEDMWSKDNPHTAHTLNKVPCFYISSWEIKELNSEWWLADIAPTILDLMNIEKPIEMTWKSLIKKI